MAKKPTKTTPNKLMCGVSGTATITAAEGESKGPAKFAADLYTGGELVVDGYDAPVVIDLDGVMFARSMIANLEHNRSQRVGQITSHEIDGGIIKVSGVANAATQYRDEVIESAAEGFKWEVSIEAMPIEMTEVRPGASVEVNGKNFDGPLYVARQSTVRGMGFVTLGADENNRTTIAAKAKESDEMNPELKAWIEELGLDAEDMSEKQLASITAAFEGRRAPKQNSSKDDLTSIVGRRKAERERISGINRLIEDFCDRATTNYQIEELAAIGAEAIEKNWTVDQTKIHVYEASMPTASPPTTGTRERGTDARVLEAAVCLHGNLPGIEKHYDERILDAADRQFRDISLNSLFVHAARANGYTGMSTRVNKEILEAAFSKPTPRGMVSAAGFSTTGLPGLLSNIANKFLLQGWEGGDMTWSRIASVSSVNDFKERTSYRLNGFLDYEEVGPSGEIKHGQVGNETYSNRAKTYAQMLAITRTDFINDDLGALTAVPRELGFGAIDTLNVLFWTKFLGAFSVNFKDTGNPFFHSTKSNVSTGVFGPGGVDAANAVFMKQTKPNGNPVSVSPEVLLVPPELKMQARALVNSTLLINGGTNTTIPSGNVWEGMFRVESAPYMSNALYTGQSNVAYYLLANASRMATIDVAFLNGRRVPVVETADVDFNQLGVQMRGYHDYGVELQEPRAGVRSTGA